MIGFVLGVVLVAKSHTIQLSSSTTVSRPATPSTSTPATTSTTSAKSTTTAPTAPKPANQVKVVVANGTDTSGAAGRIAAELATAEGYSNYAAVNTTSPASASAVYYAPGYEGNGAAIDSFLQLKTSTAPMPAQAPVSSSDLQGADVLVIVGPDLAAATTSTSATQTSD